MLIMKIKGTLMFMIFPSRSEQIIITTESSYSLLKSVHLKLDFTNIHGKKIASGVFRICLILFCINLMLDFFYSLIHVYTNVT